MSIVEEEEEEDGQMYYARMARMQEWLMRAPPPRARSAHARSAARACAFMISAPRT